jgi:hypothetical protein
MEWQIKAAGLPVSYWDATVPLDENLPGVWSASHYYNSTPPLPPLTGHSITTFRYDEPSNTYFYEDWIQFSGNPNMDRQYWESGPYPYGPTFNFVVPLTGVPTLAWGWYFATGHI